MTCAIRAFTNALRNSPSPQHPLKESEGENSIHKKLIHDSKLKAQRSGVLTLSPHRLKALASRAQGREKYSHRNGIRRRHEATTCSGNTGRSRNPASGVLVERESLLGAYTTTATKGAEARVAAAFQEWDEGRVIANVCATLRTPASRSRVHAHVYTLGSGTPVAGIRRRRRGRSQRSSERL